MRKITLLCACLLLITSSFAQKKNRKQRATQTATTAIATKINYKEIGSPMPPLKLVIPKDVKEASLYLTDSNHKKKPETWVYSTKDLPKKEKTVVMLFNPTCEHCQDQARLFTDSVDFFKSTNHKIVLISGGMMMPYLEFFNTGTHVTQYPETFVMGVDSSNFIENTFLYGALPQINIYGEDKKLIKYFSGNVPLDSVKYYLK